MTPYLFLYKFQNSPYHAYHIYTVHLNQPPSLNQHLTFQASLTRIHSQNPLLLFHPFAKTYAIKAFSHHAPTIWYILFSIQSPLNVLFFCLVHLKLIIPSICPSFQKGENTLWSAVCFLGYNFKPSNSYPLIFTMICAALLNP